MSAASLKSAKILSKFWGDEMDTDASDGTLDPETDSEAHHNSHFLDTFNHLVSPHETVKKSKGGSHKNQNTSSEHIQKRSKKGVIKSNLTVLLKVPYLAVVLI